MTSEDTAVAIARIETIVCRMEEKLFGNGQPGELAKIDGRIKDLELARSRAHGAFWVISSVVTFITGGGLLHLLRGGK